MNYEEMNVHDLILAVANQGYLGDYGPLSILESALRKAVVREASVGVVSLRTGENVSNVSLAFGHWVNGYEVAVKEDSQKTIPSGDYDLILKKTDMQKQMEEQVMEDQQKEDMLAEDLKRHQQQDDRERWARENL